MKFSNKAGFTIIETMLFFAVSGLFIAGVILATGSSINTQRYRDSVSSLQSMLQQQYSDVGNVSHDTGTWSCSVTPGSPPVLTDTGSNVAIGKSDCVILGKYITTDDGLKLTIRSVVGTAISGSLTGDIIALHNSNVVVTSALGVDTYTLEWGSTLKDTSGSVSKFSILMLRSPISGLIRTFINPSSVTSDNSIGTLINSTYLQPSNALKACVKYDGSINSDKTAIYIAPDSTGASGVETLGDATSGC